MFSLGCKMEYDSCKTCSSGDCETSQVSIQTMDIFTPYSYSIIKEINGVDINEPNYKQYNLFTLNTKLSPQIKLIGKKKGESWFPRFEQRYIKDELGERMVITVQIYDGIDYVAIQNVELRDEIQDLVNECVNFLPEYSLVLHDVFNIFYRGVHIDHTWYKMILKMIPIVGDVKYPEIDDKKFGLDIVYASGGLYVKLSADLDYESVYDKIHISTLDNILRLYKMGIIALDKNNSLDVEFIRKWNLVEYMNGYWTPQWTNRWIAQNPSLFLRMKRAGIPYIQLNITMNNVVRHYVTIELKRERFRFVFQNDEVLVWVKNIIRADKAHHLVTRGIARSIGRVKIDKVYRFDYSIDKSNDPFIIPMLGKEYVEYVDLNYGVVRSVIDIS